MAGEDVLDGVEDTLKAVRFEDVGPGAAAKAART